MFLKSYTNDKCLIQSHFNSTAFFITMIVTLISKLHPKDKLESHIHCVKRVQIRSFFWSVFSCIPTEYGDLQ